MAMTPVEKYYDAVLRMATPRQAEVARVESARGMVLATDVRARFAIPPFTNSAMDGFAVRAADVRVGGALPVVTDIAAGDRRAPSVPAGSAARIMTGAPLPQGTDAVLQVEFTEDSVNNMRPTPPTTIVPTQVVKTGQHVRHAGEDIDVGELAFTAGTVLGPAHLSALVALGYGEVSVIGKPRVGVVTTGAELGDPGVELAPGQIPDSNSILVCALVEENGGVPLVRTIHTDEVSDFRAELARIASEVDLIVTTGGVSAGAFDVVKAALQAEGVSFEKVSMQPGKPQGHGMIHHTPILCLPGNPVSVFVSMELFVLPVMSILAGRPARSWDSLFTAEPVGSGWRRKPGRVQFMPISSGDGGVVPASTGGSGSHLIGSLPHASGLARVAADCVQVNTGDMLPVLWCGKARDE